jgi:hypothetical protein
MAGPRPRAAGLRPTQSGPYCFSRYGVSDVFRYQVS